MLLVKSVQNTLWLSTQIGLISWPLPYQLSWCPISFSLRNESQFLSPPSGTWNRSSLRLLPAPALLICQTKSPSLLCPFLAGPPLLVPSLSPPRYLLQLQLSSIIPLPTRPSYKPDSSSSVWVIIPVLLRTALTYAYYLDMIINNSPFTLKSVPIWMMNVFTYTGHGSEHQSKLLFWVWVENNFQFVTTFCPSNVFISLETSWNLTYFLGVWFLTTMAKSILEDLGPRWHLELGMTREPSKHSPPASTTVPAGGRGKVPRVSLGLSSSSQQTLIGHLLCAWHSWPSILSTVDTAVDKTEYCPQRAHLLVRGHKSQINICQVIHIFIISMKKNKTKLKRQQAKK